MSFSYAEKWSRSYKEAVRPLTEAQARKRHNTKGAFYTVLVGDPNRPSAFIEFVSFDSVQVEFLDHLLRSTGAYQFVVQPEGQLFMVMAAFNRFDDDGKRPAWSRRFSFRLDGSAMSFERDYVKDPGMETVTEKHVDVSLNWEPYPEFGNYDSIARFERGEAKDGEAKDSHESEFSDA